MTTIQCEICLHKLATVETGADHRYNELALPLTGTMFAPPDPWMPPPFAPELDWEWMRCPMCGKRPFTQEGRFLLYDQVGYVDVAGGAYRCPETGMLTGALIPPVDLEAFPDAAEAVDHDKPADLQGSKSETEPKPADLSTKPPTVLEEVYRMADAGMKPGEISKELAKAGVVLHQLAIAAKLRARAS